MDAASLAAAAAAISSPLTNTNPASAALTVALEHSKANLRLISQLSQALKTALTEGNYVQALNSAGERMMIYNDINDEYLSAFEAAMTNEDNDFLQRQLDV